MGLLNHQALQIIKGVGKLPGDTASAESDTVVINLMATTPAGFSLVDWSPNIPSLKAGGAWADSPLNDGRNLVAASNTNVIETITVRLTGATCQAFAANFAALQRIIQDARRHWTTFYQIEPVYLYWWAAGAPGPQYALIFNIDLKVTFQDSTNTQAEIILSIEREFGWRGVKPGGSPQEWAFYLNGIPTQFNNTNIALGSGSTHAASGSLYNAIEWSAAVHTQNKSNFIDIPASRLAGDLPPLLCIIAQPNQGGSHAAVNLVIARCTKPLTQPDRKGNNLMRFIDLAASGGALGTDATFAIDATRGIIHNPVSANQRIVNVSFATATDQIRLTWTGSATFSHLNPNLLRGRYRMLIRCEQVGGVLGNVTLYVKVNAPGLGTFFTTQTISPKIATGSSTQVHDLGILTLPTDNDAYMTTRGRGQAIEAYSVTTPDYAINFTFELHAARTGGAGTLSITDIILIPIDEGVIQLIPLAVLTSADSVDTIYDNTGYFARAHVEPIASARIVDANYGVDSNTSMEIRGNLDLIPGVDNRLYFTWWQLTPFVSIPYDTANVFVNIVPRWSGIRDR